MAFVFQLLPRSSSSPGPRSSSSAPTATIPVTRSRDALCPDAVRSLREYYTQQNSLPQTAGCAHELGRIAQMARDSSLGDLCRLVGAGKGASKFTSLHSSPVHAMIQAIDLLSLNRRDEIVLHLYDDPTWTIPIYSHAETLGVNVVWVSDTTIEKLAKAVGSRTRVVALQLISPLLGTFDAEDNSDDGVLDALRFAQAAGLPVIVDATHALGAVYFRAEQLAADCVVIGGGGIGAHAGTAVALWSETAWKKYDVGSAQSCSQSESNTAALVSMTSSIKRVLECENDYDFRGGTAELAESMYEELGALNSNFYTIEGGLVRPRAIPVVSISISIDGVEPVEIARRLYAADIDGATAARLRVLPAMKMGRGRKKVERKQLISVQFSPSTHSTDDMRRFLRTFNGVAELDTS